MDTESIVTTATTVDMVGTAATVRKEVPLVVSEQPSRAVDYLAFRNVSVFILCVVAIVFVLHKLNIFGGSKPATKLQKEQKKYNDTIRTRRQTQNMLAALEGFANRVGGGITPAKKFEWDFRILRLFKPIEAINRPMTAIEVVGLIRFIQFVVVSISIAGLLISGSVFFAIMFLLGILGPMLVPVFCDLQIASQDAAIERDFADFYLLVHSTLLKGARAHIAGPLLEFTKMCDNTMQPDEHKEIREFVAYLSATISVLVDEQKALSQIRDKYKSATVINFCNLASSALKGVENEDNLLTFKMELIERQKAQVRAVAKQRADKAIKSIFAIWVILAEFVIVVMVTRLMVVF